jgi:hypothetical protein
MQDVATIFARIPNHGTELRIPFKSKYRLHGRKKGYSSSLEKPVIRIPYFFELHLNQYLSLGVNVSLLHVGS